ncbi:hypothetical protein IFM89_022400 [Coptis chinensis]|uniref:Uncharacterized protein n=1 Tax=Coptis chinensis TaxID=261450 RepID=A0A835IUL2_9MAGN|nr:hypothetical protein IFM89_022400 [Coptis chinensis]
MVVITEEMRAKADLCFGDEGRKREASSCSRIWTPASSIKRHTRMWLHGRSRLCMAKAKKNKIEHKFEKIGRRAIYGTRSAPMLISIRSGN